MKYAVVVDVDGDIMYVPENTQVFMNYPKAKLFDDLMDAEDECSKWNTGVIIDYETGKSVDKVSTYNDIRPFSFDERQRAKEREEINNGE